MTKLKGVGIKCKNVAFVTKSVSTPMDPHVKLTTSQSSSTGVQCTEIVIIFFLGAALFLISSFHATSPIPGFLSYSYHHYLFILGPLTFTVHAL